MGNYFQVSGHRILAEAFYLIHIMIAIGILPQAVFIATGSYFSSCVNVSFIQANRLRSGAEALAEMETALQAEATGASNTDYLFSEEYSMGTLAINTLRRVKMWDVSAIEKKCPRNLEIHSHDSTVFNEKCSFAIHTCKHQFFISY